MNTQNPSHLYGRVCKLLIANKLGEALDLSEFRIKFSIKRSGVMTPNVADIRIYNLSSETMAELSNIKEFTKIILQAGYEENFGAIFKGNIKQVIIGRESATDTFIDILAGDGEQAYNFSVVNTTIAAGATQMDQLTKLVNSMEGNGVGLGYVSNFGKTKLPRGKVLFGNSKDFLRDMAKNENQSYSIQDEELVFIPNNSFLPGEAIVLTSATGMIGTPQQTIEGIAIKSLLNPLFKIGRLVIIDNKSIEKYKINFSVPGSASSIPVPITADGVYYTLYAEHEGDTRGPAWYTNLICLNQSPTSNSLNSVKVGQNG